MGIWMSGSSHSSSWAVLNCLPMDYGQCRTCVLLMSAQLQTNSGALCLTLGSTLGTGLCWWFSVLISALDVVCNIWNIKMHLQMYSTYFSKWCNPKIVFLSSVYVAREHSGTQEFALVKLYLHWVGCCLLVQGLTNPQDILGGNYLNSHSWDLAENSFCLFPSI